MISKAQAVNDLLWVVDSAPLLRGDQVAAPNASVDASQIDTEELMNFLNDFDSYRVGRYFEALLHFWLRHVRQVEIVSVAEQVRDGKITIGELDLIFDDEEGVRTHCEAAVKFFLYLPGHEPSEYPGPNANDNLERKATKIFEKQLPLSRTARPDVERREAFVRGQIFYHFASERPTSSPTCLSPGHGTGLWAHTSEFERVQSLGFDAGVVLNKPTWLGPSVEPALPFADLLAVARDTTRPRNRPILVELHGEDSSTRCFVVDDDWPHLGK